MRRPVAVVDRRASGIFVFCDDGTVWRLLAVGGDLRWTQVAEPLPDSPASASGKTPGEPPVSGIG